MAGCYRQPPSLRSIEWRSPNRPRDRRRVGPEALAVQVVVVVAAAELAAGGDVDVEPARPRRDTDGDCGELAHPHAEAAARRGEHPVLEPHRLMERRTERRAVGAVGDD